MKTIEFESRKYEVEDWVNWVSRDQNGSIFGYERKPSEGCRQFLNSGGGQLHIIKGENQDWSESLTKV